MPIMFCAYSVNAGMHKLLILLCAASYGTVYDSALIYTIIIRYVDLRDILRYLLCWHIIKTGNKMAVCCFLLRTTSFINPYKVSLSA